MLSKCSTSCLRAAVLSPALHIRWQLPTKRSSSCLRAAMLSSSSYGMAAAYAILSPSFIPLACAAAGCTPVARPCFLVTTLRRILSRARWGSVSASFQEGSWIWTCKLFPRSIYGPLYFDGAGRWEEGEGGGGGSSCPSVVLRVNAVVQVFN